MDRSRSVRSGTPVSARAAARKPAVGEASGDDDAKVELLAKLEELQEKLQQSEMSCADSQKQAEVLQNKLDAALTEQGLLEETIHEHAERIEELETERKDGLRARKEMEQVYGAEKVSAIEEREAAQAREDELQRAMQRMKETMSQRELRERTGIEHDQGLSSSRRSSAMSGEFSNNAESRGDRHFAPPSSLQRSESRSSSRVLLQKDKIIESLRLELAEAQIKLIELENRGGGTLQQLEKEMYDVKMQNARLMEENESFQLLLSEKTLNGDLAHSDLLRPPSNAGSRPPSRSPHRTSLADELEGHESFADGESGDNNSLRARKLQGEVNSLKDQNKALTLYINNIISRLLQHEQFEAILDQTPDLMAGPGAASRKYAGHAAAAGDKEKELPAPPASKDADQPPTSLLQRAGSVLRGRAKPPRPLSQLQPSAPLMEHPQASVIEADSKMHENPETAPRIPLARASSTRGSNPHRRTNSDWSVASVVTNMYKGPSPGPQGPLSPGLTSPNVRGSLFSNPQAPSAGSRIPSVSAVPTMSVSEHNKENHSASYFPQSQQRESRVPAESQGSSPRSSVISNPGERVDLDHSSAVAETSNPASPPRSEVSSGERETRPGGAVMMGSKPRPLRLVQEAQDDKEAKKAANRGSWFGWMNKGGTGPAATGLMAGRAPSAGEGGG